jgi:hypothetical protein
MKRAIYSSCLLGLLGVAAGCGPREHIRPDFGKYTHQYWARQQIWHEPAKGSPLGLDSEEAAVINASYRKSIGGAAAQEAAGSPSRVLLLQEGPDVKPR